MEKTRIGVIGLGGIAQLVHLPILSKMEYVELAAVAEIIKNRLKSVGEKYPSARQYLDYNEMLSSEELDAVVIATPTDTHAKIALECLKNKKHVLIEKPIARNYNEAKEINKASKKYNKIVMQGMNLRFRPDAMLLKSIINSGELGELFYVRCGWLRKQSSSQKWFMNKKLSGGGVIIDLAIVILDLALWMMGNYKIETISVKKFNYNSTNVEDSAIGLICFEKGYVLSFEVSWALHSESDSFTLITHGTKGSAYLNPLRVYRRLDSTHIDYTPSKTSNAANLFKKSYENELKHFIGAIRKDIDVLSSSEEALGRMKLLEAIYKSAETGKEVKF